MFVLDTTNLVKKAMKKEKNNDIEEALKTEADSD